ncbi:MAG: hypothetical protein FD167_62 [bacterium]|nr:MAG: hypothetical protein FD167_62 [bacterium]
MAQKKTYSKTSLNIEKAPMPTAFALTTVSQNNSEVEVVFLDSILAENNLLNVKENRKSNHLVNDSAVKKTLAEISFIEANETLEKGDLPSAITKYKEAIGYSPDNADYYLKLIDSFKTDTKYKLELEVLLKDIARKFPDNNEVKEKLQELNLLPKQQVKTIAKPANYNKNSEAITKSLKNDKESKPAKSAEKLAKMLKLNTNSASNAKTIASNSQTKKLKNNVYIFTETNKKQKPYAQIIILLFLVIFPIGICAGLNISYKETIIETIPIAPETQSNLAINQLYFCWTSNTDKADYLLQIEQEGKFVLERYTREKFYLVSQEEAQVIKKNTYCTWRTIPVSPRREPLNYKTSEGQFMLIK